MARLRSICTTIVLASAIISRPAAAQAASVSLTHTVSVTVPARVKVQVATSAAATTEPGRRSPNALALSINATQAWSLSIDAPRHSKLQWSRDGQSNFSAVAGGRSSVASGPLSPVAKATRIYLRSGAGDSQESPALESDGLTTVLLTIVAQ